MTETPRQLYARAWQILQDRNDWEQKQRRFYIMRHDGLRRRAKPFPSAADLHIALVDEAISKLKPFTLSQVFSSPRLATFVAMRKQLQQITESASDFFTFEMRQRSNFVKVLETCVDTMLLRGRGIIKSYVDPYDDYRIVHENVDPLFLLMSDTADNFDDADEWVHVRQMSVPKFKRDRRFFNRVEEEMSDGELNKKINLLRGGKDAADRLKTQRGRDFDTIQMDKEIREGVTHSISSDTIIIWEHYVRTLGGITVYTYAPVAMDVEIRKPYGVPYKVGGRVSAPFFSFQMEIKDDGWYSPRGVAEKIADKEIYACKMWNAAADAITFLNTPMITSDTPLQNPANYRMVPGEYIPGNVRPVQFGQPAMSYGEQIMFARGEAELSAQMPDYGIEKPGQQKGEKRTATENNRIASLQSVNQNHAGSIFKECLMKLFRHNWGLILEYKRASLTYFISEDLQSMPEQAMHDEYLITPGGAADDWDKQSKLQKAVQRYEALKGAPNINQDELVKDVLDADDGRLSKRLLMPQNQRLAMEAEDEAMEIVILTDGFPASVKPGEDHLTRIQVLLGWMQKQGMQRKPVDPIAKQRIHQHLIEHLKYLQQLNPQAYKGLMQQIKQSEQPQQMQQRPPQPQQQQIAAPQMAPAAPGQMAML
jgi:hypothetical protein